MLRTFLTRSLLYSPWRPRTTSKAQPELLDLSWPLRGVWACFGSFHTPPGPPSGLPPQRVLSTHMCLTHRPPPTTTHPTPLPTASRICPQSTASQT